MENRIAISLFRSILTIPMHMVYGIMMGYYLSESKRGKKNTYYRYISLFVPIILHGSSDYLLSTVTNHMIYIIYAIVIYIVALRKINELSRLDRHL